MRRVICLLAAGLGIAAAAEAADTARDGKGKLRLFILSGQSNMVGLDEKSCFTPFVTNAFPADEVLVVKYAVGGTPIAMWYKDWKAPAGATAPTAQDKQPSGSLYETLMRRVQEALRGRSPDSVSFVWMQGERDAKTGRAGAYEDALRGLIRQVRKDTGRGDATVVIGRLSDHLNGQPQWDAVRAIQERVAAADPYGAWVDTDALNGPKNDLHYTKPGYAELGRRFAEQTVRLLRRSEPGKTAP